MSNYTKATNFATKDALTTGNPLKTLSGTELDDEFNAIQVANNTKANASNAALTGTPVAPTAATATDTTQIATTAFVQANDALQLNLSGGAMTGAITTNSTFDGRDVATDGTKLDTIETSATADQTDAEIRTAVEAATDSNVFTDADHTKLNAIEASADVTDATNVTAAGALMDSEVTNLADVKAFDTTDYATAAQGTTADAALPKAGGTMTGALNVQHAASAVAKFQSTATNGGYVTYVGGSTTYIGAPLSFLGTGTASDFGIIGTGANNFVLGTSSAEKMRIDAAGNVGIGTSSPLNALQIGAANPITMNGNYPDIHFNGYYAAPHYRAVTTGYSTRMAFNPSNGSLSFKVGSNSTSAGANYNPIERVTLDKDGHLLVGDGITLGNGQTYAAANTLDDYEEGTFTPTWVSTGATFSYVYRSGTYTKIGNRVDYNIYVKQTASGTLTNTLSMTGLPFTSRNSVDSYHMTSIWGSQTASSQASWGYVEPNNTIITSRITTSAVATPNFYGMANGYWVIITGTYFTS